MSETTQLKNIKDVKSLADLNPDKLELLKGDTPKDIEEKCLKLCRDYVSGNWEQQTVHTVTVERISGGLMNQIYHCSIKEPDQSSSVPQEVAVRFYGTNSFAEPDNNLREDIISLILSENKIGPKVLGVFEGGLIQKYYPHRQFKKEEQSNKELVEKVFKTLARIHSLDIPIKKFPAYYNDRMDEWYELAYKRFPIEKEMDEYKCETIRKTDFKTEIKWIRNVIEKVNSPIVFTHKDYRSSNLLITEPNDELVVCDFDLTCYGYRGLDFVVLSGEFCREKIEIKVLDEFPLKDPILMPLIDIYVEECERINGKNYKNKEINSIDNILKEIKIFYIFFVFNWILLLIKNDETVGDFPMNRKLCMEMAEINLQSYLFAKQFLIDQKIINMV